MKIGFALITASPYFNKIVEAENSLHEFAGFHHRLEYINNIPHTTLFQGTFDDHTDYKSIADALADHYETSTDHFLHFNQVVYVPSGWYFYTCVNNDNLQALHDLTLELSKNHIVLEPERLNRNLNDLTQDQIDGIRLYGYRYSAKAFFPHITLGRTSKEKNDTIITSFAEELEKLPADLPIGRLTVYKMGDDGMHAETLYERSFI